MGRRLSESLAAFRDVYRNPNLRRLQLAFAGSVAGQYAFAIAIAVYAYRHGGATSVGVIALVRTIPSAVLAPFVSGLGEALAGFRAVLADRNLRVIMGLFGAQTVVAGAMGVLVVVTALRLLDLGTAGVGWLYAATGVGGIIGAGVTLALVSRKRLAGDFGIGLLLWGIPFVVMGVWPNAVVALVMLGVLGIGNTLVDVSGLTLLQRNAPDAVRARVFGVFESMVAGTIGLGAIFAPLLVAVAGIRGALVATGLFLPVLAGLLWRRLVSLDAGDPAHLDLLRSLPLFAPLPPQSLERLARSLQPLHVAAGEVLFNAGDEGDRFYIIESGELAVELATGTKTAGPGRFVGEIALLRNVPRTATVRAVTDAELLALGRDEFLGAVTGHAPAHAAANEIVGERLALSPV